MKHFLLLILCVGVFIQTIYILRKSIFRYTLLSACSGLAALVATDLIGGFISINVPLNLFTIAISTIGGLPGVILYHMLQALFIA